MKKKPVSDACKRNQDPILEVLRQILETKDFVFEIGSGTGQHAVYFAQNLPDITWVTSDFKSNHEGIKMWKSESGLKNLQGPRTFSIGETPLPNLPVTAVFCANVLHMISWEKVCLLFKEFGERLNSGAKIIIYGPFNYANQFTSESNRNFDLWLRNRDEHSSIKDFEKVVYEIQNFDFSLQKDYEMPANNRTLYFLKQ